MQGQWDNFCKAYDRGCVRPIPADATIPQVCTLPAAQKYPRFCFSSLLAILSHHLSYCPPPHYLAPKPSPKGKYEGCVCVCEVIASSKQRAHVGLEDSIYFDRVFLNNHLT